MNLTIKKALPSFLMLAMSIACAAGCSGPSDGPAEDDAPIFNAIDPSVSCPAGQIGWDFSTGGASENDSISASPLSGIRVIEAIYGKTAIAINFGGWAQPAAPIFAVNDARANLVELVGEKCNGELRCTFTVDKSVRGDPLPGAAKDFDVSYQCGAESPIYTAHIDKEANGKAVTLECGPQINVKTATFGANCGVPAGADTAKLKAKCDGARHCEFPLDYDPKPNCGEGFYAEYTCGDRPTVYKYAIFAEERRNVTNFGCEALPTIKIKSATYGAGYCKVPVGYHTARVAGECDGKTSCSFRASTFLEDKNRGCTKPFEATWTCDGSPREYNLKLPEYEVPSWPRSFWLETAAQVDAAISCVGAGAKDPAKSVVSLGKKACVPKECEWNSKRDSTTLACVGNAGKAYVSSLQINRASVTAFGGTTLWKSEDKEPADALRQNIPIKLDATLSVKAAPVTTKLTAWLTDRFVSSADKSKTVDGFSCVAGHMPVVLGSTGTYDVNAAGTYNILPSDCHDPRRNSYADAARRVKLNETDFRAKYTLQGSKLHYSFDTEGAAGWSKTGATSDVKSPNPIGFFYDPTTKYVDMIAYLQQREVLTDSKQKRFDAPTFKLEETTRTEVRAEGLIVREGNVLPLRLFSPFDPPPITANFNWVKTGNHRNNPYTEAELIKKNLRYTVEIYPPGRENEALSIGRTFALANGVPTAKTETASLIIANNVKDKIFGDWRATDTFSLRACLALDGVDRDGKAPDLTMLGLKYTVAIPPAARCSYAPSSVTVQRDYTLRNVEPQASAKGAANTRSDDQGDGRSNTGADQGAQSSCTTTLGAGGYTQTCRASQRSEQAVGGGTPGARALYSLSLDTTTTDSPTKQGAAPAIEGELFDHQVLDVDDDDEDKVVDKVGDYPQGTGFQITITPNWDLIIKTLNPANAPNPEWTKGKYGGQIGLALGIGYKLLLNIGPVPVIATFTFSGGASVALVYNMSFKPEADYPCISSTSSAKCFGAVPSKYLGQKDAAKECGVRGGRLAEMVTANDRAAILAAAAKDKRQYWIGGQGGIDYSAAGPTCYRNQTAAECKSKAATSWRWAGSDKEFARSTGTNATFDTFDANAISAPVADVTLTSDPPNFRGTVLGTDNKLIATSVGNPNAMICEWDAASRAKYLEWRVALNLGAGIGFGVSACTPSEDFGLCIDGSFNLIDFSVQPGIGEKSFTLYGVTDTKFGNLVYKKAIGERSVLTVSAPWALRLFTAEVGATLNAFLFTATWKIAAWDGITIGGGELYHFDRPSRVVYQ